MSAERFCCVKVFLIKDRPLVADSFVTGVVPRCGHGSATVVMDLLSMVACIVVGVPVGTMVVLAKLVLIIFPLLCPGLFFVHILGSC